jgi:hypothetical protein
MASLQDTDLVAVGRGSATYKATFKQLKDSLPASAAAPADATDTVKGIVELATAAEVTTGTDTTRAVTPAGLKVELDKKAPLASPALTGTPTAPTAATGTSNTQIATTAFVTAFVSDATEAKKGIVELATSAEVQSGTDTVRAVTPKGLADNYLKAAGVNDPIEIASNRLQLKLGDGLHLDGGKLAAVHKPNQIEVYTPIFTRLTSEKVEHWGGGGEENMDGDSTSINMPRGANRATCIWSCFAVMAPNENETYPDTIHALYCKGYFRTRLDGLNIRVPTQGGFSGEVLMLFAGSCAHYRRGDTHGDPNIYGQLLNNVRLDRWEFDDGGGTINMRHKVSEVKHNKIQFKWNIGCSWLIFPYRE